MGTNALTAPVTAGRTTSTASEILAAVAGSLAIAATAVVFGLRVVNEGAEPDGKNWWIVAWLVVGAADSVVGAALLPRPGHRRLAVCLLIVGLASLTVAVALQSVGYSDNVGGATAWVRMGGASDWATPIAAGVLAALVPWELAASVRRPAIEVVWWTTAILIGFVAIGEAVGLRGAWGDLVDLAIWLAAATATAATLFLVATWWRRRASSDDPLPGWLAAGAVCAWLSIVPSALDLGWQLRLANVAGPLLLMATVPLLVVGAIVSVLRERPGRFHGVAHEVIGWLVLSVAIVVVYTGLVAGLGRMVGGSGPTWLLVAATGVIAVTVEPARRRIRDAVDRLVWGARDNPLEVVRGVVDHVGADSGDELLPALVASLQRELRLEAVAIDLRTPEGWQREAALGPPTTYERTVELEQQGEVVGRLVIGWEHGPSLRDRDERIIAELAGPLGLAVGWVRLAADLRRSSVAVVSAREEERRRLRRDLHDGLGPALTGVSLSLRTAVRQLERAPDASTLLPSRQLLARAADEVDRMVVDVKRIVRDLRPTALDQLGLVAAVAEFARTFSDELEIHLTMPSVPVELPAAVEVATYRIVTEAVTNVVRHARAAQCWLTISTGESIDIDVVDDGVGIDAEVADGVGWTAMRERAAELGGSVQVAPHLPHGTRVHVRLPAVLP
jgi:signal transduction histidine kinase